MNVRWNGWFTCENCIFSLNIQLILLLYANRQQGREMRDGKESHSRARSVRRLGIVHYVLKVFAYVIRMLSIREYTKRKEKTGANEKRPRFVSVIKKVTQSSPLYVKALGFIIIYSVTALVLRENATKSDAYSPLFFLFFSFFFA